MDINKTNQYPFHVIWTTLFNTDVSKTNVTVSQNGNAGELQKCLSIGLSFKNHFELHAFF